MRNQGDRRAVLPNSGGDSLSSEEINRRRRIIQIAYGELGKRGPYANDELWCGRFVCWVLNQAGLAVPLEEDKPGERLCSELHLASILTMGDIVRYPNAHCGIIDPYYGSVVSGGMRNEVVKLERRGRQGKVYSIDELIRCAEMTGAQTGEVA